MGMADAKKTRRLDPKEVELLMGGGEGQGGIFTWREKHRRKVSRPWFFDSFLEAKSTTLVGLFCVSHRHLSRLGPLNQKELTFLTG